MTFVVRTYDEIVRDLLTSLTGGRVAEAIDVPPGDAPLELPPLAERPARRISHVEGFVSRADGPPVPYRFTPADYELAPGPDGGAAGGSIRFRPGGRRPAPGTRLTVNYYPAQTRPVPLTDLNVGSVVRTLLETVGRELAMSYLQLDHVYRSAFVETAEGAALDKVVALVGVRRLPAGHPAVKVRISRRAGTPGRITLPAGTAATDRAGNRYLAAAAITFEPNETAREALFVGESLSTGAVEAGAIDRFETVIAGVSEVTNPQPAWRLAAQESDADLRRRAQGALHEVQAGTVDALRFGLLSIPGVKTVQIVEMPQGVPGEVRVDVAYEDGADVEAEVRARIEQLRPAGIRLLLGSAARRTVEVDVRLVLAGAGVLPEERPALVAGVEAALRAYLGRVEAGAKVRQAKVVAQVLGDERIAEAEVLFRAGDGTATKDVELASGEVLEIRALRVAEPTAELQAPRTATVTGVVPIHLVAGVTLSAARAALYLAIDAHLATRDWQAPLTVDGLLAAVRDDSRYAVARDEVTLTVELAGAFTQLVDGAGQYAPAPGDKLARSADGLVVEAHEGTV